MSLTLWQGDRLLGTLHIRASSSAKQLEAVLLRSDAQLPLTGVSQHFFHIPGSTAVIQDPLEPDIVEERGKRPLRRDPGPVPMMLLPDGQPLGVDPAKQLHLRTENGEELETRDITLMEHRPHPQRPDPEIATLPQAAILSGSIWLVWARPGLSRIAT